MATLKAAKRLQELLMHVHHCRTAVEEALSPGAREIANQALQRAYHQVRKHCEDHRLALPHDIPDRSGEQ